VACVGNAVLPFHCRVHEFLRSLLKLLFSRLRIGVGDPSLVLNLDVDGLAIRTRGLLALSRRISCGIGATVHGVVHHSSVEWIVLLLLIFVARHDASSNNSESR
jgi:hypothetical protein